MSDIETKAEKAYKIVVRKNPQTGESVECAVATDSQKVYTDQLLSEVAKNGHGIGKASALKGAYFALLSVIRDHLINGDIVYLDDFGRIMCTIRGVLDESGILTKENNSIHTSFSPHKNFQFKVGDFAWKNETNTTNKPKLTSIHSCTADATVGKFTSGKAIRLNGRNLGKVVSVLLRWLDGDETCTATVTPEEIEPTTIRLAWPAALAEVAGGTEVTFTVSTGSGNEGSPVQQATRTAVLVA